MKKFGFGKKSEGGDDGHNRTGLFGRKKPAPQDDNPYTQQPAEDPYARMTPYQQARADLAAGPQGPRSGAAGLPSGPAPRNGGYGTPPPSYQGSPQVGGGYAPEKFGAAGGYGGNRYDASTSDYGAGRSNSALPSKKYPSRGPGGYGGLGPADEDAQRELPAGARNQPAAPPSYTPTDYNGAPASDAAAGSYDGGYGEQRELTAEELERQEYNNIKEQIRDTRKQTVNSAGNAAMQMENAIDVGRGILVRMAQQGDMLHNTEKNLDLAENQNRVAMAKTKELATLSRSMFLPHFSNPLTSTSRQADRDQQIVDQHRLEAEQRDATRGAAFASTQQMEQTFRELERPAVLGQKPRNAAARTKYEIEEDSDDDAAADARQDERIIESSLRQMEVNAPVLHQVAEALGGESDRQTKLITRLGDKSRAVDENLAVTRYRMGGIH